MDNRLRLTLLGGALGSGKTTWARHHLHAGTFGPAVQVLVNEAAMVPVDDQLLLGAQGVTVLAGGCACCVGRAELVAALRGICDQRGAAGHILLETSGLADPAAVVQAIQSDPVLVHHILLDRVVVAVDALHGLTQLQTEALCRQQITAADALILTKADRAEPAALNRLRATLLTLNPAAPLTASAFGTDLPLPPLPADTLPAPLPDVAAMAPQQAASLTLPPGLIWADVMLWLSALLHARGDRIVRVKGVLTTPAGRLLLQTVQRAVQSPEILPPAPLRTDNRLAFIGRGFDAAMLDRSLRRFLNLSVDDPAPW